MSALGDRADFVIKAPPPSAPDLERLPTGHRAIATSGMRVFVTCFPDQREALRDRDRIAGIPPSPRPASRMPLSMGMCAAGR
jgi:hypothetical protein